MTQLTFHFKVPAKVTKKERWYVASCSVLDVHSQGETFEQANENLKEALTLFFISCNEMGTLEDVLKQSGFKPAHPPYSKETIEASNDYIDVHLPFNIFENKTSHQECHA